MIHKTRYILTVTMNTESEPGYPHHMYYIGDHVPHGFESAFIS